MLDREDNGPTWDAFDVNKNCFRCVAGTIDRSGLERCTCLVADRIICCVRTPIATKPPVWTADNNRGDSGLSENNSIKKKTENTLENALKISFNEYVIINSNYKYAFHQKHFYILSFIAIEMSFTSCHYVPLSRLISSGQCADPQAVQGTECNKLAPETWKRICIILVIDPIRYSLSVNPNHRVCFCPCRKSLRNKDRIAWGERNRDSNAEPPYRV